MEDDGDGGLFPLADLAAEDFASTLEVVEAARYKLVDVVDVSAKITTRIKVSPKA
jgi:hypothetical protein